MVKRVPFVGSEPDSAKKNVCVITVNNIQEECIAHEFSMFYVQQPRVNVSSADCAPFP